VELDYPPEKNYEGVLRFVVLRVETPIMYWVRILGYWERTCDEVLLLKSLLTMIRKLK
jgi:hypothetical protein